MSLRVAIVVGRFAPHVGGVELVAEQEAAGLAAAGHTVHVLTQDRWADRGTVRDPRGFTITRFGLPASMPHDLAAPGLFGWLSRHARDFDVVHVHGYHTLLPATAAAAVAGRVPVVVTGHYHGTGHSPLRAKALAAYRPVGAAVLARAVAVVCVSAAEQRLVTAHFPRVTGRTVVIGNGVTPDPAVPPIPAGLLTVGRLEPYKRVDVVIDALTLLPAHVTLTVVGDGPARVDLEARAAAAGVADRVRFTGRVDPDTLAGLRAGARVYLSLSAREAFGLTMAEAITAGRPVVASAIDAQVEVARLAAGSTGNLDAAAIRLVPVDPADPLAPGFADPAQVAAAVTALWNTTPTARTPLPTWAQVADAHATLFTRVASSRRLG